MPAGRAAWVWTPERRQAVQADAVAGLPRAQIAEKHGVSPKAVEHAFTRGQVRVANDPAQIERICLCCSKPFATDSAFIRMCQECKSVTDPYNAGWIG